MTADDITPITHDETIETHLAPLAAQIGDDYAGYRGHIYRVFTYAMHFLHGEDKWRRPVAFALVFHDAGMWTDRELAYLEPSEALAERVRQEAAPDLDPALIRNIIHWHHKITPFSGPDAAVVNAARKADWIDATAGLLTKGLPRAAVKKVTAAIPAHGFHQTLMRLAGDLSPAGKVGGLARVLSRVYKF